MNPDSKLWEFLHLGSHVDDELPERHAESGRLVIMFIKVPTALAKLAAKKGAP